MAAPPAARELAERLDGVIEGLGSVIDELREISRGIHPSALVQGGLSTCMELVATRTPFIFFPLASNKDEALRYTQWCRARGIRTKAKARRGRAAFAKITTSLTEDSTAGSAPVTASRATTVLEAALLMKKAGKGALPWDHPLQQGAIGVTGSPA